MKILFLGDIVGRPGREVVIQQIKNLKEKYPCDFVIANGENSAAGHGLTLKIAVALLKSGISVITTGNHVWDQRSLIDDISHEPRILRPVNYPVNTPGKGYIILQTPFGKIAVVCLQGLTFMNSLLDNPFHVIDKLIKEIKKETKIIFVDFHAETTSEKTAMGWHLDGKVSAVVGTHTHIQTNDARLLLKNTAYITDVGMCGPRDSVLGCDIKSVLNKFTTALPTRFGVASCDENSEVIINAVLVDIDEDNGMARSIETIYEIF